MTLLSLSTSAANALASSIMQGLLIAVAVALCLRLFPRIPAAARSLIWTAVFVVMVALPFLPTLHHASTPPAVAINPLWSLALVALWLILSLLRATQLTLSAFALRRLARTAVPVPNPDSTVTLCTSTLVDRPSVVGFFSRRILLPSSLYASLTPAELDHVLLHETEHLRRRDDWTNLLQKLALVAVPLNPVLLWVERRLCLERELACDDRVLRATGAPRAYATCLTHLAEHSILRRSLTLALGFFERQSELSRRVHRILLAPQQAMTHRQTLGATGILLVVLTGGTWTVAHAPQLISFTASTAQIAEYAPLPGASGNIRFQPASFHTSEARSGQIRATPTLIKAALPSPARSIHPRAIKAFHGVRRTNLHPYTIRTVQADWSTPPQRLILTTTTTKFSYSILSTLAVATPHGWIIFQL